MSELTFRTATRDDLPAIVGMLAADQLGALREDASEPLDAGYTAAFEAINSDPNNELLAAWFGDELVGVLQLTFIPYLTYRGSPRALIEGVRVSGDHRGIGIGQRLMEHAIAKARARRCHMVQLTSNKTRTEAIRFYERLGFTASHEGMKLILG